MTLVLSNVTQYGVAMAADDALVETFAGKRRVLFGTKKLFGSPHCHCGLMTWGAGALRHPNHNSQVAMEFIMEIVLADAKRHGICAMPDLIEFLVKHLNEDYGPIANAAMIDISGCMRSAQGWLPAMFQIGNSDDPYRATPVIRQFESRIVRSPRPFDPNSDVYPIANGLENIGYWVDAQVDAFNVASDVTERTEQVPGDSLRWRQHFLSSVARAVSEIHVTMDLSRAIGPNISTLGVSSINGEIFSNRNG